MAESKRLSFKRLRVVELLPGVQAVLGLGISLCLKSVCYRDLIHSAVREGNKMSKKHVLDRHHIPDRATCLKRYLVAGVALLVSLLLADDVHDMVIGLGADHRGIRTTGLQYES